MKLKKLTVTTVCLFTHLLLIAQTVTGIQADIREMSREADPFKTIVIKDRIITNYHLDSLKDTETIDMLNGSVAIAFARKKNYAEFEKYIGLIQNKFNQTSMLNMAASELLDKDIDAVYAGKIAKETLEIYDSFKDDPKARPAGFSKEDWERFMSFAKYPYYDTYAKAMFALGSYKEALQYQRMAFDRKPEEGLPVAVERYAKLLELNGDKESAKQILLKMAGMGKLNKGMIAQLQSFYVAERGSSAKFDIYLDSLQTGIRAEIAKELRNKILNEIAPAFSLKDINGKQVRLSGFKGKIVILDLWATWCVPCIASFPAMQKLVKKHPDVVFLFIAVNEEENGALKRVKTFVDKHNYPFKVLMDEPIKGTPGKYIITSSYKPDGIPAKYFIDKEGKLRFTTKGFDSDAALINEIDAIISILKTL